MDIFKIIQICLIIALFEVDVAFSANSMPNDLEIEQPKSNPADSHKQESEKQHDNIGAWMIDSAVAAKAYVEGLDNGLYAESWSMADPLFQKTMTEKGWVDALNITRKPLGKMKNRMLKDQRIGWNPKGLPEGVYMVVEYKTAFEKAPNAVELLTLRHESENEKWRVLTYEVTVREMPK